MRDIDKQKLRQHESYERNKEKVRLASKEQRLQKKELLRELKNGPCSRCGGVFPPCAMDFHHRDPSTKAIGIGLAIARIGWDKVLAEIAKCDLLCANCHRIVEHEE